MPRSATTATTNPAAAGSPSASRCVPLAMACSDPMLPLLNLSAVGRKVDSLRRFLSDSIATGTSIDPDRLRLISDEISSSVQQIIINGAALIASAAYPAAPPMLGSVGSHPNPPDAVAVASDSVDPSPDLETGDLEGGMDDDDDADFEIVEVDSAELMEERVHSCKICGKGFKRDANLRMHMRSHGDEFKTLEALFRPSSDHHHWQSQQQGSSKRKIRFSCPFVGCNRNRSHNKFRPLKSLVCVKNHFKRSHGPKMYMCTRCNKKSFSVLTDLRSHLKHCGECRWKCSCGTTFSRKEKLFGHLALFEGHKPVTGAGPEGSNVMPAGEAGQGGGPSVTAGDPVDLDLYDRLMEDEFDGMEEDASSSYALQQDLLSLVQRLSND